MAAALLLALFAGCGGSSGGDTSAGGSTATSASIKTSSLGEAEFIKQANAACQEARKGLIKRASSFLKQQSKTERNEDNLAGLTKAAVLPTVRAEMAAIRRLGAPAGDEDEVGAFVAAEQEAVAHLAKLKHIYSRFEMERYFTDAAKLARAYGIDGCANGEE
jgi:hypothetical protein